MSHQDRREPLPKDYHFPVHSCGCPSCVSRLTPEHHNLVSMLLRYASPSANVVLTNIVEPTVTDWSVS